MKPNHNPIRSNSSDNILFERIRDVKSNGTIENGDEYMKFNLEMMKNDDVDLDFNFLTDVDDNNLMETGLDRKSCEEIMDLDRWETRRAKLLEKLEVNDDNQSSYVAD